MAFETWVPNADGNWDTASDWSGGGLPASADNVVISSSTEHTIIHSAGNDTIASLSVGNDILDLNGGSLTVDGAVSMASGYIQTGGSLFTSGTVSVTGNAQLLGGLLGGNALFEATGTVTLSNYTISGDAQLINSSVVDETGSITLSTGSNASAIVNQTAGLFDITAGIAINNGSTPVASFSNVGTLEMTATNNVTSHIYVNLTSTGLITAVAGSSLEIDGPSNSVSGTIAGTGQVSFGGGTTTIAKGTTISVGTLGIYNNGTNVIFAGAETMAGSLSLSGGSTLTLGGNTSASGLSDVGAADILLGAYTLTIQGSATFEQSNGSPLIAGTGKLVTLGTTTLINNGGPALVLGGSAGWINSGTVIQDQSLQVGTASGSAAAVTNQAGGVFNVALGGIAINNGSAPVSTFSNAGTLEMTATGNVTSRIYTDLVSTGTIMAIAGSNLEIDGPANTISGTIAGTGQVSFGGGSTTIASKAAISVATLGLYGTGTNLTFASAEALQGLGISGTSTLTLNGNTTVAGSFSDVGATDILLGSHTLTLQGSALFQQYYGSPFVGGSGKLVTTGTTTLNGGATALVLGGSVAWDNAGTVLDGQSIQVGTNSGAAASIVNQAHDVFDLTVSGITIANGSAPISTFSNAGTLEMTATDNRTSSIQADLVSTGVILAVAGSNLEIDGPVNTLSGKVTGTGQVSFGAGTTTIAGGTTINAGNLAIYHNGTNVVLGGNESISSSVSMGWGSVLSLGGYTLTLTGPVVFYIDSQTPLISGSGTVITQGTTTIGGGGNPALTIGSSVTWENMGLVTQTQSFTVGNNTNQSASLLNDAGAVFDLAGYVAVNNGSTPVSTFSNAGTLEMTGGNTTGYVRLNLSSTGVLSTISGSNLELDGPSNMLSGTITGAGQVLLGGGTTTIAGNTMISVGTLQVYNTGTILTFGGAETIGGNFVLAANSAVVTLGGNTVIDGSYAQYYGSTLSLGAYTLSLDGNALFQNGNAPTVTGTGTLATFGTTTLVNNAALVFGCSATWSNSGTVVQDGSFQLGNTSTATTLVNQSAGVFDLAGYVAINNGSTPASIFSNAGILEMTGGSTTGYVRVDLLSSGVISAITGSNLEIDGPANTISGTITGAGQVSFAAGTTAIAGGTSIDVGTLALYNASTDLTLGGNVTVSGTFNDSNATTISLAGHTLTFAAAAVINQYQQTPLIAGKGTLVTQGATSIGGGGPGLLLGGTVTWNNFGMVTDAQSMQFGDSVNGAASVDNEKGGVFDIVANGVALSNGSTLASTFANAGLLEMTVGGGASLAANVMNTGTVLAQGGGLALSGAITGNGLLEVQSNGALGFSGTVQSTETAKFLDTTGRLNITLPSASAFGAEITGFAAGDTIDLTNISNATAAFSAGVLTFTDNTSHAVVATLNFANSPVFAFASDGRGGTLVSATSHNPKVSNPSPRIMQFIGPDSATALPRLSALPGITGGTLFPAVSDVLLGTNWTVEAAHSFPFVNVADTPDLGTRTVGLDVHGPGMFYAAPMWHSAAAHAL